MANKWVADIYCAEVHGTRTETHNILSGNPIFNVRLETPFATVQTVISRLLGGPAEWPYDTVFNDSLLYPMQKVVATLVNLVPDAGSYTKADVLGETLTYDNMAFLDVTYMPRPGVYVRDHNQQDVYWEDSLEPRYETQAMDHTVLQWGESDESGIAPASDAKNNLQPDATPVLPISGETLIHTIEGWTLTGYLNNPTYDFENYIGTTNQNAYYSPNTGKTFEPNSLLLRSVNISYAYSFRSYREPVGIAEKDLYVGRPTQTLKMIYEYRPSTFTHGQTTYTVNWNKYWRVHSDPSGPGKVGYYYIRYNSGNKGKVLPFTPKDHRPFLAYTGSFL